MVHLSCGHDFGLEPNGPLREYRLEGVFESSPTRRTKNQRGETR